MTLDRPEIHVTRVGDRLVPCSEFDQEMLRRFREGEPISVVLNQERSSAQHRLYWAVLRRVCEATDCQPSPELLNEWAKLTLGLAGISTARKAMPDEVWRRWFLFAIDLIRDTHVPDMSTEDLLNLGRETLSDQDRASLDAG